MSWQQGQRPDSEQGNAAGRVEVSGSPRYGAPVTTGHDNQQHAAQSHGPSDRGNVSSAQVNNSQSVWTLLDWYSSCLICQQMDLGTLRNMG